MSAALDTHATVLQRNPPSNIVAERSVIGAILANNRAYEQVSDFLSPDHFTNAAYGRIYELISRRIESGQLADAVTLAAELKHMQENMAASDVAELLSSVVGIINVRVYGQVIHDAWLRRELIDIGETVVNDAYEPDGELSATQLIERAEQSLFNVATSTGQESQGFIEFHRALADAITIAEKAYNNAGSVSGLTTGLRDVDAKLGGLHPSDLIILAGRPGMGKTALATKIAFGAAKAVAGENGAPATGSVAIFSLEMSAEQLATRILSEESRVSSDKIRRGDIGQRDFDRFVQVARDLSTLPLHIDDTPAITVSALRTRCRRLMRTKGLSLVIVDYLQLMRPAAGSRPENRVLEISQMTQALKALAKELAIPVIALSQLSRAVENREDKRPQLADLRESGSIEQDADCVMFVYRDEYYLEQRMPKEIASDGSAEKFQAAMTEWQEKMAKAHNRADLIIAKQRHGPTGVVPLMFEAEFTRFGDLAIVEDSPYL